MTAIGLGIGVSFLSRRGGGGGGGSQIPANTSPPTITRNGLVLTCNPGTWTNSPTLTYRWTLNGTGVVGATSATWSPPASAWGALFSCEVVGRNAAGAGLPALAQAVYIGILDVTDPMLRAGSIARLLSSTYRGGPLIRVRNSAGNAQDIGHTTTGLLDTTALWAFLGTSGWIVRVYEQCGTGLHWEQTDAAKQPGILQQNNINGNPAAYFNKSQVLTASDAGLPIGTAPRSMRAVYKSGDTTAFHSVVSYGENDGRQSFSIYQYNRIDPYASGYAADGSSGFAADTLGKVSEIAYDGTSWLTFRNGVAGTTTSMPILNTRLGGKFNIGAGPTALADFFGGVQAQWMISNGLLTTTNRAILDANDLAFYGITP